MTHTRLSASLFGSLAALTLLGVGLEAGNAAARASADASAPLVQITGPDSRVATESFRRVRDQATWEAVWTAHVGDPAAVIAGLSTAPIIDFNRCEVVAYFRGSTTNTRGERVDSVDMLEAEAGRRLRFTSSTYQTSSMVGEDSGVSCTPFGFWIVERDGGPIVIEENTQNRKDRPPLWRQRARLEADG